jgi:rubrerythrin
MSTHTHIGPNKTGVQTSRELVDRMLEGSLEFLPSGIGDEREIARVREDFVKEAEPLGSVPPPPTFIGMVRSAKQAVLGEHPVVFMDRLGARLAFERAGTRLWEAVLSKFDAYGGFDGGPSREDLARIAEDEFEHFRMLEQAVRTLGGDPTVVTPDADLQATLSKGVLEVVVDARTDLVQSLEGILVAELVDNDAWEALTELATLAGEMDLVSRFEHAAAQEATHLALVRSWLARAESRA